MHHNIPDERRCTAHYSPNHPTHPGERCRQNAMVGLRVCYSHGGANPKAKAAGRRRVAEAKMEAAVARALARLNVAPVDNPLEALAELAGQVVAFKDALADRVNALTEIRYEDAKGAEQLRSEVALFERALDRCNTVLGTIARLDIDGRLARIEEEKVRVLMEAVQVGLASIGVVGEQAEQVKQVMARKLRRAT
ncbi:hypothetical protein ACIQGZ_17010 [Streptomyces sp. NPDC092296]|uniref:hypothetical protein n=1 Tax=Streptomyces sp. NPDC092296 TaxID=3366012 RepID=UPI0038253A91